MPPPIAAQQQIDPTFAFLLWDAAPRPDRHRASVLRLPGCGNSTYPAVQALSADGIRTSRLAGYQGPYIYSSMMRLPTTWQLPAPAVMVGSLALRAHFYAAADILGKLTRLPALGQQPLLPFCNFAFSPANFARGDADLLRKLAQLHQPIKRAGAKPRARHRFFAV